MMDGWRRRTGFLVAMGLTSVMLSTGFIWASQQRSLLALFAGFTAWTGYLMAHYLATGSFMDGKSEGEIRVGWPERIGIFFGGAVLILGMLVGIRGVRTADLLVTNIGGVLFLGGYVIAHQIATGEPL